MYVCMYVLFVERFRFELGVGWETLRGVFRGEERREQEGGSEEKRKEEREDSV